MTFPPEVMREHIFPIQAQMQEKFRQVPPEGKTIEYLGKEFIVYPEVFWPHEDSKAIVKNYAINPGDEVADVCTGSGVIACFSGFYGAKKVVGLDISPNAIRAATENFRRHGLEGVAEARLSDVFSALKPGEQFDVVTMNPPFTLHDANDYAAKTIWDAGLHVQNEFFANLDKVLKLHSDARAYVAQASFGSVEAMLEKADAYGFVARKIGENPVAPPYRIFYAYELKRKNEVKK